MKIINKQKNREPKRQEQLSLDMETLEILNEEGEAIEDKPKRHKKQKLSKFERRSNKIKKQNDYLNLRGIPKYWTILIVETLFIFGVELIVKALLNNLAFDYSILRILFSSMIVGTIITLIVSNMPNRLRVTITLICNFFIALYAWLQVGFINFLGSFMSLGNAEQGTKITDYIWEFICAYDPVVYVLYIPFILVILYFIFERIITKDGFAKKIDFKNALSDVAILAYIGLLSLGYYATLELDFMQNKLQLISNKALFKYPSNPALAIKNFGTSVYFVLDVKGTLFGGEEVNYTATPSDSTLQEPDHKRKIDDEAWEDLIANEKDTNLQTLNNYFINRPIPDENEYTGKFKGKNLIMVMLESVAEPVFHEEYKEYFPTLYKLYNEGMTGVNNYSPRNNCATGDSEVTSQTSLYSISTTCTSNTYKDNEYKEALMYMLQKNGYETGAYHDYTEQYYSRKTYERNLGSMRYYGVSELGMSYNPAYKEWPSDLDFVNSAMPLFENKDKFASFMITVTAHTPYIYNSEMGNKHLDLFKDTDYSLYLKRYLSKVKEVDLAMERMLERLEIAGKLDDTVIVIFGDHYPYGLSNRDYQVLAPYDIKENQEIDRTPFIIYNSGVEGEKITKYTTPLDYTPTLLNLLGIDYDPRLYLGHDVWSDYTDYAVFPDNSWQSSFGFYNNSKAEFYPKEGYTYDEEQIIKISQEINDMRSMSSLAIKNDYMRYLNNYIEKYNKEKVAQEEEEESGETKTEDTKNKKK